MSGVLWCSQGLDLSLLLLVFRLIFTVVSRLLLLYSTVDKTSLFEDNGLLFWVPDVLCWHSEVVLWHLLGVLNVLLMNLWERKWSPRPIPPPS